MKRLFFVAIILATTQTAFSWGQQGHRIVGLIAQKHLSKKAKKNIQKILGPESVAMSSNFMDFIKSDSKYRHMSPWHYCTIPDGKTYEQAGTPEEGDIIQTINRLIEELKTKQFSDEDEAFAIKMLIHLVGDIHQPLHVGNGQDKGGNDVKLEFFWKDSNLHRVWDSGMIDNQKLSYGEYANWINHASAEEVSKWQNSTVVDWAYESMSYREQIYDLPENMKLSFRYEYKNLDLVNQRLLQAGIRLAGILNSIYG